MEFYVYETRELVKARHRPVVFITSNNEKELPDAFLRRCFFHYIKFPDADTMKRIVDVHFPGLKKELLGAALKTFYDVRNLPGLKKKPSTSELLDWLKLLVAEDIPLEVLQSKDEKVVGAAAGGRAAEERAGRDAVREAGVHAKAQPLTWGVGRLWRVRCDRWLVRKLPAKGWRGAAGGTRSGLLLWRSALRADSAAMLAPGSRRETRFTHCVRSARTVAASQKTKRALRARRPRRCASRRPTSRPPRAPPTAQQRSCCSTTHATVVPAKPRVGVRRRRHMRRRAAQSSWPRARSARFVI